MSKSDVGSAVEADGTEEDCPAAPLDAKPSGMGKGLENGACVSGSRSGKRLVWLPCGGPRRRKQCHAGASGTHFLDHTATK